VGTHWRVCPRGKRRYFREWMAEPEEYERQGMGLLPPALLIPINAPATRYALQPFRHALWPPLRDIGDRVFRLTTPTLATGTGR
jgi:hypothetical protein